jgi:hypothetical protein
MVQLEICLNFVGLSELSISSEDHMIPDAHQYRNAQ